MNMELEKQKLDTMRDCLYCLDAILDFCLPKKNGKVRTNKRRYKDVPQDVKDMMKESLAVGVFNETGVRI